MLLVHLSPIALKILLESKLALILERAKMLNLFEILGLVRVFIHKDRGFAIVNSIRMPLLPRIMYGYEDDCSN